MASISSSQNGGLASNEPLTGQKDRKGLCAHTHMHTQTLIIQFHMFISVKSTTVTLQAFIKTLVDRGQLCGTPVSPSGSKVAIDVRECGAVLFEVAVEWRSKALKSNSKLSVESLKHRYR